MDDAGASLQATMLATGRAAREGARALRLSTAAQRTAAILAAADAIRANAEAILAANAADFAAAKAAGLSGPMLDRMMLDAARLDGVADAVTQVAAIPDPLGTEIARWVEGDLAPVLRQALDALQTRYKVTHAIWHQGENDALKGVSAADYRRSFDELLGRWRAQGMTAPVFISVTTRCYPGWVADNPVAQAQRALPDPARGLHPGPDTDTLLQTSELRGGACHHNARGQARMAKLLAAALLAVNQAP